MIESSEILNEFEAVYAKTQNHSIEEKLAIFDAMLQLKNELYPMNQNIFDGLEEKLKIIKLFHNAKRTDNKNS